jgi:hypothetical protein
LVIVESTLPEIVFQNTDVTISGGIGIEDPLDETPQRPDLGQVTGDFTGMAVLNIDLDVRGVDASGPMIAMCCAASVSQEARSPVSTSPSRRDIPRMLSTVAESGGHAFPAVESRRSLPRPEPANKRMQQTVGAMVSRGAPPAADPRCSADKERSRLRDER